VKHCFPPVADPRATILMLGSLPGEESLRQGRYYANPRNQFWRLMGDVIGQELTSLDYHSRLARLQNAGVALWDVVASAERQGSLDGAIRDAEANDLATLVASLPSLRAIGFNGAKAAAIGSARLGDSAPALLSLPSSSPAYTLAFEAKLERWLALRPYLSKQPTSST
jgi:double-stranded uracil-DNA glycosylase